MLARPGPTVVEAGGQLQAPGGIVADGSHHRGGLFLSGRSHSARRKCPAGRLHACPTAPTIEEATSYLRARTYQTQKYCRKSAGSLWMSTAVRVTVPMGTASDDDSAPGR